MLLAETVIPKAPAFWGVPKEVAKTGPRLPRRGVPPVRRFNIDFMGNRSIMFAVSARSARRLDRGARASAACTFGIEFPGGTVINVVNARDVTIEQMRKAFADAGVANAVGAGEHRQRRARASSCAPTSPTAKAANADAAKVAAIDQAAQRRVPGHDDRPGLGQERHQPALLALALSIAAILLYISLRFEYKMSVTAVVALVHDILITLGIYALVGREVTPNTIAALLTILGYSLYDTIVVFHRIKENSQRLVEAVVHEHGERVDQPGARALAQHDDHLAHPGRRAAVLRRRDAEGLRVRAHDRSCSSARTPRSVSRLRSTRCGRRREPKYAALKKKYAKAS